MALRVISLQSGGAVAFGGKRTSTGGQDRWAQSRLTLNGPPPVTLLQGESSG